MSEDISKPAAMCLSSHDFHLTCHKRVRRVFRMPGADKSRSWRQRCGDEHLTRAVRLQDIAIFPFAPSHDPGFRAGQYRNTAGSVPT